MSNTRRGGGRGGVRLRAGKYMCGGVEMRKWSKKEGERERERDRGAIGLQREKSTAFLL